MTALDPEIVQWGYEYGKHHCPPLSDYQRIELTRIARQYAAEQENR